MVMTSPEHYVWSNGVCGGVMKDNSLSTSTVMVSRATSGISLSEILFTGVDLSCRPIKDESSPHLEENSKHQVCLQAYI